MSRHGHPSARRGYRYFCAPGVIAGSMISSSCSSNPSGNSPGTGGYKQGQESTFDRSTPQSLGYQRVVMVKMDSQYRSVPLCPDVKLKDLPFYDFHSVLIRPTSLLNNSQLRIQEVVHSFNLSPSQATEIANSKEIVSSDGVQKLQMQFNVQVQVRFCALDKKSEQDDCFPRSLMVKVNGHDVQLPDRIPSHRPGVEAKRPSEPLNITKLVKCSSKVSNTISVQWVADKTRNYAISVNIVRRLTAKGLLLRLKNKKIQPADFTRGRIKEITSAEEEGVCAPTSIRVSVACPLGKNRMAYPCRGATTCKHLQCFDAYLFLQMNEKKPSFICPVCNKHLKFNDLCIDGYFMDVIKELSLESGNDIELYPDGRWEPTKKVKKETVDVGLPQNSLPKPGKSGICTISSNFNETSAAKPTANSTTDKNSRKATAAVPEVIALIDSSDDDEMEAETTRMSGISISEGSRIVTLSLGKEMESVPTTQRRPNENVNPRKRKIPACIELSDSSSVTESYRHQPRALGIVSRNSLSRSTTSASSNRNNNGSRRGSSSMYSTMKGLLTSFGKLRTFGLVREYVTGQSKAFCQYTDVSITDLAIAGLNETLFGNKKLVVGPINIGAKKEKGVCLVVGARELPAIPKDVKSIETSGPITKVLCLRNMVTLDELKNEENYMDVVEAIKEECEKYGMVVSLEIPRPIQGVKVPGCGSVFVEFFSRAGSQKARWGMARQKFCNRVVVTSYFDPDKYKKWEF